MIKKLYLLLLIFTCLVSVYSQEDKPIITVLDFDANGISQSEMRSIISIL